MGARILRPSQVRNISGRSILQKQRSDFEAWTVAAAYLIVVVAPGASLISFAFLSLGYFTIKEIKYDDGNDPEFLNMTFHGKSGTSQSALLQKLQREDLRDVNSLKTVGTPARVGAPKPLCPHYQFLVFKDEIRVLVLHPGNFEDEIVVHLEPIILGTECRAYEALSYAWGDGTTTHSIRAAEGTIIQVTENLYSALQHLRYQDSTRRLWIDALCIDQSDDDERSQQVRLMGDVFAEADRVIVWLGKESESSRRAFTSLEEICAKSRFSKTWQVTCSTGLDTENLNKTLVARNKNEVFPWTYSEDIGLVPSAQYHLDIGSGDWESIQDLLRRSWFHRLWVIQEVSHARRAIVLCGRHKISWETLATSLTYFVEHDFTKYLDPVCALGCGSVATIQEMRFRNGSDPLFTVILDNMYGGCRDPRDKIFALMSISEGRDAFDWNISFDYSLSVEELYKRFAIWDIIRNESLRVLSCATTPARDQELPPPLPSWVPDWTRIIDRHLLVRASATSEFSAGLRQRTSAWFTHDKTLMHVEGVVVDSIQVIGTQPCTFKATSIYEVDVTTIDQLILAKEWLAECWNIARAERPMDTSTYEAFWPTMICGLNEYGFPAQRSSSKYFLTYLKFMREAPERFQASLDDPSPSFTNRVAVLGNTLAGAVALGLLSASLLPSAWIFHHWFHENLRTNTYIENSLTKWGKTKKFCRTRDGRLARVPSNAATHDTICILHGSEVPYVLRLQEDGSYTVIGECYVHGIMHGEALEFPANEAQVLRLR